MGVEVWEDYARFHELSLQTRDVDPVYPVLRRVLEIEGVEPSSHLGLLLSVCHLTWYHIGSALRAWNLMVNQSAGAETLVGQKLPCATERRGNRDPKQLRNNLDGWLNAGDLAEYFAGLSSEPQMAWSEAMLRIERIHGNGRWASYKLAEILMKVNDFKLEPWHMGHANSSGPRHGLDLLFPSLPTGNSEIDVKVLDYVSNELIKGLRKRGLPAPVEETETTLCDFHSLHRGRYYVGNDIDQMLEQLLAQPNGLTDAAFQARYDTLPHAYLGELGGWNRVDPLRQKAYAKTGEILVR